MIVPLKPKIDWRQHPKYFRCWCDLCRAKHAERNNPRLFRGKRWERMYGESPVDFRKRVLHLHTITKSGDISPVDK